METEYIIVLVDTAESAQKITETFRPYESPYFKLTAFASGQIMHGLRHRATRPTKVIDLMTQRDGDYFAKWYAHCVQPIIARIEV